MYLYWLSVAYSSYIYYQLKAYGEAGRILWEILSEMHTL